MNESGPLNGKSTRGVYECYARRKPFTVKVGTIFESSHIPMRLAAKNLEVDESGEAFERAKNVIAPPRKPQAKKDAAMRT